MCPQRLERRCTLICPHRLRLALRLGWLLGLHLRHSCRRGDARQPPGAAPKGARSLQYSTQASTYVDPCNLFIKNLDGAISSNDLFDTFKAFGHIVSARVMRDNDGKSREFGFVSFTTPDEAHHALQAMDNAKLGARKITVRLHEPKTMRQEKLAARFAAAHGETSEAADASGSTGNARAAEPTAKADKRQSRSYFQAGVPADANGLGGRGAAALAHGCPCATSCSRASSRAACRS